MVRSLLSRLLGRGGSVEPDDDGTIDDSGTETETDVDGEVDEDSNDLWDLIHPWQYRGQYVQSGGDVRDEQERALRDIQRQAEEIERSEQNTDPHPDN